MASNLHLIRIQICKPVNPLSSVSLSTTSSFPFSFSTNHQQHAHHKFNIDYRSATLRRKCRTHFLVPHSSMSSSSPPNSKEESISQAKICLSNCLEKPINNLKLTGKLKKSKQPRFRVEIPLVDDSPASLSQLAFEVFGNLPIKRKGSVIEVLILWPNLTLAESATKVFESCSANQLQHIHLDIPSVMSDDTKSLSSSDLAVFLTPDSSQLQEMKMVAEAMYPKPVVIFNPRWMFEDEGDFGGMSSFVRSFEVIYSFMGLEVRGILSKRKGAIFKCVRDGVLSGEKWNVFVEEEELKLVSKFSSRPSITEVENVLYNMMAMNSPITKSAKFLRGLVSNVTGKNLLLKFLTRRSCSSNDSNLGQSLNLQGPDELIGEINVFCPQRPELWKCNLEPRFCSAIEVDHTCVFYFGDARVFLIAEAEHMPKRIDYINMAMKCYQPWRLRDRKCSSRKPTHTRWD